MKAMQANDEISFKELVLLLVQWISYFKSKWKVIFAFCLLGSIIGFIVGLQSKVTYTAELTLALDEKGNSNSYAGLASQLGMESMIPNTGGAFSGENNIALLKSRRLIESALLMPVFIDNKNILLINRYIEFNNLREKWAKTDPELQNIQFVENENREKFNSKKDSILYIIYKQLKKDHIIVDKEEKKLSIIRIRVLSNDELFAQKFTEVLVQVATRFYIDTKTQKSKYNLQLLEYRMDSVKAELDNSIYGAALSKDQNTNVILAKGTIQSAKKQLNVQILTAMYTELIKNVEMAKYSLMREEPLIQIIDNPNLPLERTKLSKMKSTLIGGSISFLLIFVLLVLNRIKQNIFPKEQILL